MLYSKEQLAVYNNIVKSRYLNAEFKNLKNLTNKRIWNFNFYYVVVHFKLDFYGF